MLKTPLHLIFTHVMLCILVTTVSVSEQPRASTFRADSSPLPRRRRQCISPKSLSLSIRSNGATSFVITDVITNDDKIPMSQCFFFCGFETFLKVFPTVLSTFFGASPPPRSAVHEIRIFIYLVLQTPHTFPVLRRFVVAESCHCS